MRHFVYLEVAVYGENQKVYEWGCQIGLAAIIVIAIAVVIASVGVR